MTMIFMTNGVAMKPYAGKVNHVSLRAAAKRLGSDWYPVSVTATSAPYAKDILKAVSAGTTTLSATQLDNAGLRRKNPSKSKGVTLLSRAIFKKKPTRRKNPTRHAAPKPRRIAAPKFPYIVQELFDKSDDWHDISACKTEALAKSVATHYAKHTPGASIRVMKV